MPKWIFRLGDSERLAIVAPQLDENTSDAVLDFLTTDVGPDPRSINSYRGRWEKTRAGEYETIAGNGTEQEIEGGRVRLESLYEQWETVYFTIAEFEELLDDYAAFLQETS